MNVLRNQTSLGTTCIWWVLNTLVTTTNQFESNSAEGCGESVLYAEGALGGEVLEEQRLCHGDVVQAVRELA